MSISDLPYSAILPIDGLVMVLDQFSNRTSIQCSEPKVFKSVLKSLE